MYFCLKVSIRSYFLVVWIKRTSKERIAVTKSAWRKMFKIFSKKFIWHDEREKYNKISGLLRPQYQQLVKSDNWLAEEMSRELVQLRCTAWKVSEYEVFLVHIFVFSVRIQENMDQKKLCIWTLFTQWYFFFKCIYRNRWRLLGFIR